MLELCVLGILSKEEAYPSDIIDRLREAELIVVEGTIYPLLNRLRVADLLAYRWGESSSGPPRKYYYITDKGKEALKSLNHTWLQLNEAVKLSTKSALIHE